MKWLTEFFTADTRTSVDGNETFTFTSAFCQRLVIKRRSFSMSEVSKAARWDKVGCESFHHKSPSSSLHLQANEEKANKKFVHKIPSFVLIRFSQSFYYQIILLSSKMTKKWSRRRRNLTTKLTKPKLFKFYKKHRQNCSEKVQKI